MTYEKREAHGSYLGGGRYETDFDCDEYRKSFRIKGDDEDSLYDCEEDED